MKRKILKIGPIALVLIVLGGIFGYSQMNVLDKLYCAVYYGCYQTVYKVLDVYGYDWEWFNEFRKDGIKSMKLVEESIKDNWYINLTFIEQGEKEFNIFAQREIGEEIELELYISYLIDEHKITCEPVEINVITNDEKEYLEYPEDKEEIMRYLQEYSITQEDIKGYLDYVLYDELVRSWVDAHGGIYSAEKRKIEKCLVDNSCEIYVKMKDCITNSGLSCQQGK